MEGGRRLSYLYCVSSSPEREDPPSPEQQFKLLLLLMFQELVCVTKVFILHSLIFHPHVVDSFPFQILHKPTFLFLSHFFLVLFSFLEFPFLFFCLSVPLCSCLSSQVPLIKPLPFPLFPVQSVFFFIYLFSTFGFKSFLFKKCKRLYYNL